MPHAAKKYNPIERTHAQVLQCCLEFKRFNDQSIKPNAQRKTELNSTELFSSVQFSAVHWALVVDNLATIKKRMNCKLIVAGYTRTSMPNAAILLPATSYTTLSALA